jgi:non-ribosomal peptide synthase protein (TIGR01720 family)
VQIQKLPVTTNGKLDKKALPPITMDRVNTYTAPSTREEKVLVKVLQEVLNHTKIGIYDNFFELGGDSIKAIRAVSKLRELGYETSIKNIMKYRDVETIATNLQTEQLIKIEQEQLVGIISMLPIQLEFFENHFKEEHHYNQAMLLKAKERMNPDYITKVMNVILHKHDMLRAVFLNHKQIILDSRNTIFGLEQVELRQYDNSWFEMQSRNQLIQKQFNLEEGPLVKSCLYHCKDGDYLFICIHHLIVDGVSWRIILEDIETAYKQCIENTDIILPKKTSSYKKWIETLQKYAKKDSVIGEFPYWKGICEEAIECNLSIHLDEKEYNRQAKSTWERTKKISIIQIEEALTKALLFDANKAYATRINDLLLTSLGRAVNGWINQSKICVELESHGREDLDKNVVLDRTVGWFTNTYPIILHSEGTIENQIIVTKEMFRKVKANGIGYGILNYFGESKLPKVKPEICFNYLGVNDLDRSNGIFELVEYTNQGDISDKNHLENSLSINAFVVNSIMNIEIMYDSTKYPEEEINKFCNAYKLALKEVVTYCLSQGESAKTLSDFGILDMEDSEVNAFIDFLEVL